MGINLWNPGAGLPAGMILLTAFLLGIVHGITPDEHTWPITFSYAIGSYSTRRGLLAGLIFSSAFTLQRALGSLLAYLALARWMEAANVDAVVYIIVGLAMALAGAYILRIGRVFHLDLLPAAWSGGRCPHGWECAEDGGAGHERLGDPGHLWPGHGDVLAAARGLREVTPWMAAIHGFIAGWGFGAFATILYTVLAPSMPNLATAWLPGAIFGLGTVVVQAAVGALFGGWMRRRKLPEEVAALVARRVAGNTLLWGGLAFVAAGIFGLALPNIAAMQIVTPIHVHNLDSLGLGFALVIFVVLVIGGGSLIRAMRQARRMVAPPRTAGTAAQTAPAVANKAASDPDHRLPGNSRRLDVIESS
jgi:hypothetical protein